MNISDFKILIINQRMLLNVFKSGAFLHNITSQHRRMLYFFFFPADATG